MSVENLSNQIRLMCRMVNRQLSPDAYLNDWLVARLATMLDESGTESILNLTYYADQTLNLSFFYDVTTGHVFTFANDNDATYNAGTNGGALFMVLSEDHRWNNRIYLFFTKDGFPVFWNVPQDNGSDWADWRTGLIFVGSIVLTMVGVPAISSLGSAVVGAEVAASYPALAQGVGQTIVGTLLNGGDIEKAATGAVSSYIGAGVGGQVASATSSSALGSATAAATRAFINGGDVERAVAQSLLTSGVTNMQSLLLSGGGAAPTFDVKFNDDGDSNMGDFYTDEYGVTYGVDADGDLAVVDFVDDSGIAYATDADGDLMVVDAPSYADLTETYPVTDSNGTAPITAAANTAGANVLSTLATTALSLVSSYVRAGAPTIRTGTATATVNSNGTVTTRNPNGTVSTSKPAVGTPYLTASGSLVTNNGDGTYTTVLPSGQITTRSYAANSAASGVGGINPTMLYAGAAVVAALLLSRR